MDNRKAFKEELLKRNKKFEDCYFEEMRNEFIIAEHNNSVSYLLDSNIENVQGLKIINTEAPLNFLAFDYCYAEDLPDFVGKRCDCLLFTNKEFLFAELKLYMTSQRRTTANLKEGREQLSNTIKYFYDNFYDNFNSFMRFAIIVIPKSFYPRSQARLLKIKKEFYDKNHNVDYIEDAKFSFSN